MAREHLNFHGTSKVAIDFGTMLDAINADNLFGGINPVENAVVADAELAGFGQIIGHSNEPAMHHAGGVIREPLDFAFHAHADSGVQPGELGVGLAAYFDLLGHGWTRLDTAGGGVSKACIYRPRLRAPPRAIRR